MFWFARYTAAGETQSKFFNTVEQLMEWLQDFHDNNASVPQNLALFKAECVLDMSK